jgi:hypothetical protein
MSRRPDTHHHPDASYQQAYDALYGRATGRKGRFRRDWLPDPSAYYEEHLDGLKARRLGIGTRLCRNRDPIR